MSQYRYSNPNKTYLDDQPILEGIIKDFLDDLDPSFPEAIEQDIETIECRSRDGFIPHSHNCGGFDKQWWTDFSMIQGTGYEVVGYGTKEANDEYTEALETFFKYDLPDEYKSLVDSLPSDKLNYHDLEDLGHTDLIEALEEYTDDWLRHCMVWFGYRAMYEGIDSEGIHTLYIYSCTNQSEYYGAFGNGSDTIAEHEITFTTPLELKFKLNQIKEELESSL